MQSYQLLKTDVFIIDQVLKDFFFGDLSERKLHVGSPIRLITESKPRTCMVALLRNCIIKQKVEIYHIFNSMLQCIRSGLERQYGTGHSKNSRLSKLHSRSKKIMEKGKLMTSKSFVEGKCIPITFRMK